MNLIDSHIHLDFARFDADRKELIKEAKNNGIQNFIVPSTTHASWQNIFDLSQKYSAITPAYGIHPYFIETESLQNCDELEPWIDTHPCAAIGEIGLDYFLSHLDRSMQLAFFEKQLEVARNNTLPVILHARKAVEEVSSQLKKHHVSQGIVHSFNGSYEQAMRLIDMGIKLGFGGAITYPRATRLHALIKKLPLEAICIETDAPDQPSISFAGKRNEPIVLIEILHRIANLRDISPQELAKQTTQNTLSVFKPSLESIL